MNSGASEEAAIKVAVSDLEKICTESPATTSVLHRLNSAIATESVVMTGPAFLGNWFYLNMYQKLHVCYSAILVDTMSAVRRGSADLPLEQAAIFASVLTANRNSISLKIEGLMKPAI